MAVVKKNKKFNGKIFYVMAMFISVFVLYLIYCFSSESFLRWFTVEDGIVESIRAWSFFIASVLFLIIYIKDKKGNDFIIFKTKRNVFFLLLFLMFFFAFGEEISWGQRIIGFSTPSELHEINMQDEFNVHNINIFHGKDEGGNRKSTLALMLNMDRLLSFFMLGYCLLIPIGAILSMPFSRWLKKINMPVIPIALGIFFLLNYVVYKILEPSSLDPLHHHITEIKETLYSFLFFIVSIYFYRKNPKK